jgi:hypothetical protein
MKTADGREIGVPLEVGRRKTDGVSVTEPPGMSSGNFRDRILAVGKIDLWRPEISVMRIALDEGDFSGIGVGIFEVRGDEVFAELKRPERGVLRLSECGVEG